MKSNTQFDVAIIGGGLAGLALSIQCVKAGFKTILFEKEKYPFHKVCGEYISLESYQFLESLGLPLSKMNVPLINHLIITAPNGEKIEQPLDLGGFGISRYLMDFELYKLAKALGVYIYDGLKVEDVLYTNNFFTIYHKNGNTIAKVVAGCFGKRSNLDIKWKRNFIKKKYKQNNHYVGVKYHVHLNWPNNVIALHNFKNGYCGISKVENNICCICYLTTAKNLQMNDNSICNVENNVLKNNPHLKYILSNAKKIYKTPVTIAQISFDNKKQVENHILMVGDASGMISPLCGNGMSMALHGSKLAFNTIKRFLLNNSSRTEMELQYSKDWKLHFKNRLTWGRNIQYLFGKKWVTNLFIKCLKPFPSIINFIIMHTHGSKF